MIDETNENLKPSAEMDLSAYKTWLQGLSLRYRQSQIKASVAVNVEMLKFYWSLGADIVRMEADQPWGSNENSSPPISSATSPRWRTSKKTKPAVFSSSSPAAEYATRMEMVTMGSEKRVETMSETSTTPSSFICSHVADCSLLAQGFTLPGAMLVDFTSWFGTLAPGQARAITIRLDGASYSARLGNRNFDRAKWPSHREMYQVR